MVGQGVDLAVDGSHGVEVVVSSPRFAAVRCSLLAMANAWVPVILIAVTMAQVALWASWLSEEGVGFTATADVPAAASLAALGAFEGQLGDAMRIAARPPALSQAKIQGAVPAAKFIAKSTCPTVARVFVKWSDLSPVVDADNFRFEPTHMFDAADVARQLAQSIAASAALLPQFDENATFATNTVDKLKYQLDNFEPARHALSSPQWNPVTGDHEAPRLLIGVSTVGRRQDYLTATLASLIDGLAGMRSSVHILVFNANVPPAAHSDISNVKSRFRRELESGLLEIVERLNGDSPYLQLQDPEKLSARWGDARPRVLWRSKQVLDVAHLMGIAAKRARRYPYFLMMEDDIIASANYVAKIRRWCDAWLLQRTDWTMASFYNPWEDVKDRELLPPYKFFGVIGQLFRAHDLPTVVEFLEKNFDQSPLDWLFVDFLKKYGGHVIQHTPSYFQHQGRVSSLAGKEQGGRSVDFEV